MMINDKLMTMKMNPRAAKHAACRRGRKENDISINNTFNNRDKFIVFLIAEGTELYLNLGSGQKRLLVLRNNPDVEDSR